jgi:hypothetical protein
MGRLAASIADRGGWACHKGHLKKKREGEEGESVGFGLWVVCSCFYVGLRIFSFYFLACFVKWCCASF